MAWFCGFCFFSKSGFSFGPQRSKNHRRDARVAGRGAGRAGAGTALGRHRFSHLRRRASQGHRGCAGSAVHAVRAGVHCAPWAHRWPGTLGSGGAVRVSMGWFNKRAEVEKLSNHLEEAVCG